MFRKILFPTDFSEGARRAIERFEKENEVPVKECIYLHVIDEGVVEELLNGYSFLYKREENEIRDVLHKIKEETLKKMEEHREKIKNMLNAESIKIVVRVGIPYEEIVRVADEENVSLILLPSHGKLGYSHELFGSTTMRVLKKTKKPVLVIKTHRGE